MKEKYLILKVFEVTSLQLAMIRSQLTDLVYIEIENLFVVSSTKSFKDILSRKLNEEGLKYLLIHVNEKAGGDVKSKGLNRDDLKMIKDIILDN